MSKTPKPLTLTLILSAATVLGYLSYRAVNSIPAGAPAERPLNALLDNLPDLAVGDLDGRPVPFDSWPGKPLVINFWATWCAPCLREIPLLKSFQADHPEFQLVGIAVDRLQAVRQFADEMQFNYPVLVGQAEGMNAAASFGVEVFALPFTVFTAPDGATLGVHTGELHSEHLAELAATVAALGDGSLSLEQARARTAGIR